MSQDTEMTEMESVARWIADYKWNQTNEAQTEAEQAVEWMVCHSEEATRDNKPTEAAQAVAWYVVQTWDDGLQ